MGITFQQIWDNGLINLFTFRSGPGLIATTVAFGALVAVVSYLLGSINLAIIISHKFYNDDIRTHGSGNAGMTNVMRTYGKKMAAITFGGDFLKAVIASLIGRLLLGFVGAYVAGFFCFLGHIFPCFYKFKGGKGIVTACAMVLMTDWRVFLVLLSVFMLLVLLTRFISLGSVISLMFYPIVLDRMWALFGNENKPKFVLIFAVGVMVLGIWGHRKNIVRIFKGTENKFTFKVKDKETVKASSERDKKDE